MLEPIQPRQKRRLSVDITLKSMALAVATIAACWLAFHLLPIVLVAVVALFLVGTLNPAVEWLEHRGLRRSSGIAIVFVALLVMTALLSLLTVPALVEQAQALIAREPEIRRRIADVLAQSRLTASLAPTLRHLHYDAIAKAAAGTAFAISSRAIEIFAYLASSVFLALYVMIDRDRLRGGLFAMLPRSQHVRLSRVMLKLEIIVSGYIRGQVFTSALMATFVFALLALCRISNALPIAVFAGLADVLPYVGVILSIGPAALAASPQGWVVVVIVIAVLLAYEEFESRFLVPRIYGRALRLPSSIVLLALLIGTALMGIVGALLALPVAATIRMLLEELRITLPGEQLDDTVMRQRDESAEQEYAQRSEGVPAVQAAAIAIEMSEERQTEEAAHATIAAQQPEIQSLHGS
jgi:predicted PurR-regulated permease PerM